MESNYEFHRYGLSTPALTLEGIFTPARLVDCYDGDTMTVIIPFKGDYFKYTCRMMGIDTCEMKSKVKENKETAIKARNRFLQLAGLPITNLADPLKRKMIQTMLDEKVIIVWLNCYAFDKYGRLLADVHTSPDVKSKNIARTLIEENLGYEYHGDTKLTETEQADQM